jgi:protein TonB
MKSIICLLLITLTSFAQNNVEYTTKLNHTVTGEKVYLESEVDVKPKLMYGENAMQRYIARNLKQDIKEPMIPKIVCSFIVEIDGTISDVKVLNSVSEHYKAQTIKVFTKFDEPWYPAVKDKKQVRCQYVYMIN